MNLHNLIMNIPITVDRTNWLPLEKNGYAHGHRDARHSAAELSLKAEARIEELEEVLKEALPWLNNYEDCHGTPEEVTLLARIIEGKLK